MGLLRAEILPFVRAFVLLIGLALAADLALHLAGLVWIGRYLGIAGSGLIIASFGHSLRKRRIITAGRPAALLRLHEAFAWAGSLLVLVHAGVHFHAVLPWLALAAMLVNVASGLTGKYLMQRAQRWLQRRRGELRDAGLDEAAIAERLYWDSLTFGLVKDWRKVHVPITLSFAVLALAHSIAALMFWSWR
jgi:hypothetical protein